MREELVLDLPHRQVVFFIPKMLRIFFKFRRKLFGQLCRAAVQALLHYFQATASKELIPGVMAVIQTFGERINFHLHVHALVTEGGEDERGTFYHLAEFQDGLIAEFLSREVFTLLHGQELISQALVEKIAARRHSGFNVHRRVRAKTKKEAERVGKYMIRPLLSLEPLSSKEKEGEVSYRYGKEAEEEERMDYLEFIARVTSHIPDGGQVTDITASTPTPIGEVRKSEDRPHKLLIIEVGWKIRRRGWDQMIRKVYEVDPLGCPQCGGTTKIIAFLTDDAVKDKIIDHLKLTFIADRPPPPHIAFQEVLMPLRPPVNSLHDSLFDQGESSGRFSTLLACPRLLVPFPLIPTQLSPT